MGIKERVTIYTSMLWLAVLAMAQLRTEAPSAPRHVGPPTVTPEAEGHSGAHQAPELRQQHRPATDGSGMGHMTSSNQAVCARIRAFGP
jgi:hypothetical protein